MATVAESPFDEPARTRRTLPVIEAIVLAALLGSGLQHLAESFAMSWESWRAGLHFYWSYARPWFHSYSMGAWLAGLGFGLAVVVALATGRGRRRYVRAIAGAIGVMLVAQVVVDLCHQFVPALLELACVAGAVLAAAWVTLGRVSEAGGRIRGLAAPVVVAFAVVIGFPLLPITWDDLAQHHPPFTIELDAAYDVRGAQVIVDDPHPEVVEVSGVRYEIDHSDGLRFDADDIGAIKRDGGAIILHITNTEKARAFARRSAQRMSMTDALYVNGRRVSFPQYRSILLGGHLALSLGAETDAVWTALAGE